MNSKADSNHTHYISKPSIGERFSQIYQEKRIALMPFLMAGDPDLATSAELLLSLQEKGAVNQQDHQQRLPEGAVDRTHRQKSARGH